jgi:hypothetical protein
MNGFRCDWLSEPAVLDKFIAVNLVKRFLRVWFFTSRCRSLSRANSRELSEITARNKENCLLHQILVFALAISLSVSHQVHQLVKVG